MFVKYRDIILSEGAQQSRYNISATHDCGSYVSALLKCFACLRIRRVLHERYLGHPLSTDYVASCNVGQPRRISADFLLLET